MDETESDDYDSPLKDELHAFFQAFLQLLFRRLQSEIDWNFEPEFLDKEFEQIALDGQLGRSHANTHAKVQLKTGVELRLLSSISRC